MFETGEMRDMRDEMGMRCGMKGGGRGKIAARKNTRITYNSIHRFNAHSKQHATLLYYYSTIL